jgi:uncharacterized protein YbaR (Trm112 family)
MLFDSLIEEFEERRRVDFDFSWSRCNIPHLERRRSVIADHLIEILRCPLDRSKLRLADAPLVARINKGIRDGAVANVGGERLGKPIDGGLVREAGDLLYPIVDEIPVMLPDEAIALASLSGGARS